jgi:F0F1-type ATP synthase delta subunit
MSQKILAKRYLDAFVKSVESKDLETVLNSLNEFLGVLLQPTLSKYIRSPLVGKEVKESFFRSFGSKTNSLDVVQNFIVLITSKNRSDIFSDLLLVSEKKLNELKNKVVVYVECDSSFTKDAEVRLTDYIAEKTGKTVKIVKSETQAFIGGYKAYINNVVYDATIDSAIKKLRQRFYK